MLWLLASCSPERSSQLIWPGHRTAIVVVAVVAAVVSEVVATAGVSGVVAVVEDSAGADQAFAVE
jgi:hypothetical protein